MPPLRMVQESGVSYGLGTDGTKAAQINPFVTLWWAITGKALNGEVIQHQTLTREEALIATTRANALLMFQEQNIGAIKPGLLADMLVLDRDYLTAPVDEIKDIRPVATIVGGQIVYGNL
jgi:predicted amidohydrolase YtcJ